MTGAPLLALTAALAFGVSGVFLKRGLQYASPLTAALVSVTFTAGFIWILAAATGPLEPLLTWRIVPFLAAGLVAPGLARIVLFIGVHRVGLARAAPLVGTTPLLAVAIAVLALGERPGWRLLAGAAAIVAGGILLSQRRGGDVGWRRRDLAFPLLAALGFAVRDNLSRWGFLDYQHPLLGAAAATVTSLAVVWLVAALWPPAGGLRVPGVALKFLALAGLAEGLAYVAMWRALAAGAVSVVSPITNAQSIFAVVLAAVFLRDLERVTWRMAVAAALIVAGVAVVMRAAG